MTRDQTIELAALRAIDEAARAGRHDEAGDLAERALANGIEHPLTLNLAALKLERQSRYSEAETLLRRALAIAPDDIGARNALGLCLLSSNRPADALREFLALRELDPALPFVHASLGNTLVALGRVPEGEVAYRRALELEPAHGIALAGLAQILMNRGEYAEARRLAERALAAMPGYPDAVMVLAGTALGEGDPAAAASRIRALLDDGRLSELQRAYAHGLLGDALDALNDTDAAFAAYSRCNEALRSAYAGRFGAGALEYARSLLAGFERSGPGKWRTRAPASPRVGGAATHVFVLGFPRSGTSLLHVILGRHRNVVGLEDRESMIDAVREFLRIPQDIERLADASDATLDRFRAAYWQRVAAAGVEVRDRLFVDKNPLDTLKLPLISRLFPDAKILFACRDPRDIVLSAFRHRFAMSAPYLELLSVEGAARYYDAVMRLSLQFFSTLSPDSCLVRHEDVVTEFRREMTRICAFLGIDWDPAMGDFALRTGPSDGKAPTTAQVVKAMNTEGIGLWRRYRAHLAPVLPMLEPWVKRFYYDET